MIFFAFDASKSVLNLYQTNQALILNEIKVIHEKQHIITSKNILGFKGLKFKTLRTSSLCIRFQMLNIHVLNTQMHWNPLLFY